MSSPPKPVIVTQTEHGFTIEIDLDAARRAGGRLHSALVGYERPRLLAVWAPDGRTGFVEETIAEVEADRSSLVRPVLLTEIARVDRIVTNILYDVLGLGGQAEKKPVNHYVRFVALPRTTPRQRLVTSGRLPPRTRRGRRRF